MGWGGSSWRLKVKVKLSSKAHLLEGTFLPVKGQSQTFIQSLINEGVGVGVFLSVKSQSQTFIQSFISGVRPWGGGVFFLKIESQSQTFIQSSFIWRDLLAIQKLKSNFHPKIN